MGHHRKNAPSPLTAALRTRRVRRAVLLAVALGLAVVLSGCSLQTFGMSRSTSSPDGASTTAPAKRSASASSAAAAQPAAQPAADTATTGPRSVQGALATGSAIHRVNAGDRTLLVNYWTTQNPATWTADESVPIHVSAHFATGSSKAGVFVSQFRATLGVEPSGSTSVLRDDNGHFVLTAPYSYDTVVVLPGQPAAARSASVSVEFDLLVETSPGSHQYFRQTVLDTLSLTFVSHTQGTSS